VSELQREDRFSWSPDSGLKFWPSLEAMLADDEQQRAEAEPQPEEPAAETPPAPEIERKPLPKDLKRSYRLRRGRLRPR
jgi:hypothetical protein